MKMLQLKYFILLCFVQALVCQEVHNGHEQPNDILWNSYAPGQLLHKLHQLTLHIDAEPMPSSSSSYLTARPNPTPTTTRKPLATILSAEKRWDNDVASSDFNYDRAYEDFVRKYFSNSVANAYSAENSDSTEDDVATEASRKHNRRQNKCKRVRRNREICNICRNPKTGEKMETCTYSTEDEPREYSYERARNYKKTRNSEDVSVEEDNDDKEDDAEVESSETVYNKNLSPKYGSCTRHRHHHKICYICINSAGEKNKECKKLESNQNNHSQEDRNEEKAKNEKRIKNAQRIYKRKVSTYSFEHNNTTNLEQPI